MSQNGKETGSQVEGNTEVQSGAATPVDENTDDGLGDFLGPLAGTIEAAIAEQVEAATVEDNGSAEAVADADIETITEPEDTKPEDRDAPPHDEVDQEAITKLRPETSTGAEGIVQQMNIPQHDMPKPGGFLVGYPAPPPVGTVRRDLVPSTTEENAQPEGEPTIWELMRSGKLAGEEDLVRESAGEPNMDASEASHKEPETERKPTAPDTDGPAVIEKIFSEDDFDLDEVLRLERIGEMLEAVRTFNFDVITIDTETEQAQAALFELLSNPCNQVKLDIELILGKPEVIIRKREGEEYVGAMEDAIAADFEAVVESFLEGMKIEGVSS